MIEDIQVFDAIFKDEDTEVESTDKVALQLSEIDAIGINSGIAWRDKRAKTNIILLSGLNFIVVESFQNVLHLWKAYRKQEKKTAGAYLYN